MPTPRRDRRNGDQRGKAADRRRRKLWMLWKFGDGTTAPCVHCGTTLTFGTMHQDRIIPGGPYNRANVQPSCESCNMRRGDSPITPYPAS
jgi:5-methylcytosine-specific restriction endonuclease McrA